MLNHATTYVYSAMSMPLCHNGSSSDLKEHVKSAT